MLTNLHKTPWPWFGGKSDAAPAVWEAMGDVAHYVEPFAGSLAVLLRRPHECNRTYYSETVNDLDGLLVNAWRSMQMSPDVMADAASWPVSEADLHARHIALVKWKGANNLERLMADPEWHDPVMAGWWAWGQSCWIGSGWCSGKGPWTVGDDGRIFKQGRHGGRADGVGKQLPHLGNDGQGVNHASAREPGVRKKLPHVGDDGRGVNRPQAREPGVAKQLPFLNNNGRGVNHASAREPGVGDYHPMTMPELTRWFRFLSARLRHVRILNGDWKRTVTSGASKTLPVRSGGACGVFLDPPYLGSVRTSDIYAEDSDDIAHEVRDWCIANGEDPDYRIVLAGFDSEHEQLESIGWRAVEWYRGGFLKGGMGNTAGGAGAHQQKRERLWLSPHCLGAVEPAQASLFG